MNKEHLQLLLTILLQLKTDVLKLHKGEPTEHNLLGQGGICKYLAYICSVNTLCYEQYIDLNNTFRRICYFWPNCRTDINGNKVTVNCVCEYARYCSEYINKTQWTNLRRLELLEFSIKYLQEKLNEEVMESN